MRDAPENCVSCGSQDVRLIYTRPGADKGAWNLGVHTECFGCDRVWNYKPFKGEVTPEIKLRVLQGELDEAVVIMARTLLAYRQLALALGVWTKRMDDKANRLEAELKAAKLRDYRQG